VSSTVTRRARGGMRQCARCGLVVDLAFTALGCFPAEVFDGGAGQIDLRLTRPALLAKLGRLS
jgi:hypothetical protein